MKSFTFRQRGQNKLKYSHLAIFLIFGSCMQAATLQDLQSNLSNLQQQQAQANTQLQNTLDKQKQEQAMLDQILQEQQKRYDEKQAEFEAQKQTHQKEEAILDDKLKEQQKQYNDEKAKYDQFIRDAFELQKQKIAASGDMAKLQEIQKKIDEKVEQTVDANKKQEEAHKKVEEAQKTLDTKKQEHQEAQKKIEESINTIKKEVQTATQNLETKKEEHKKVIQQIEQTITDTQTQIQQTQQQTTAIQNNISTNSNLVAATNTATYDLYLANMNSLNKRMGELRDNPKGQGVWARIFTGLQTSKFALETNSFYTTIQGGYDYAFGFNGANNYLGFAISYANSITGAKMSNNNASTSLSINSVNSNAVEFAIYNAYVQDGASSATGWKNGLYTDSIIKFSYIHSGIEIIGQDNSYSTNSFAFTLSQEVGYRFILGQSNEWYIDPQAELAFGYLDQSNFAQKLSSSTSINGIQDSIFTLRGRVGSSFGYKFDKFTEGKNFKAQAYLGTYFVGDYIAGGDITLTNIVAGISNNETLTPLNSTARWTLNLGTNLTIKDNHRIYFDFERSFGGSIITQYQFNLGYRYSFGESKYTPYSGVSTDMSNASDTIKEVAPTAGYYIKLLDATKPSKKQNRILSQIDGIKTQNNGDTKAYLVGPFKSIDEAKNEKNNYEGVLKELKSEGEVIEVE